MEKNYKNLNSDEINIKDIFKIVSNYRWLIFGVTLLFLVFSLIYLYFKTPTYSSYTILKVKTKDKYQNRKDDILEPISGSTVTSIEENIALIKTFYINEKVLNLSKVNYKVQYYEKRGLKSVEISNPLPIRVTDIEIFNRDFLGKRLSIIPKDGGYSISMKYSLFDPLKDMLEDRLFRYNETIKTKYFKFKIEKLSNYNRPIEIKINYDNRYVYENIIRDNLDVSQLEEDISLIKISYSDNIEKRGFLYLKSLVDVLIRENLESKNEQNNRVLDFITQELDRIKKRLSHSERRLERYSIKNEVIKPSVQASTYITKLTDIDIKLSENLLKKQIVDNIESIIREDYNLDAISPLLLALHDNTTLNLIEMLQEAELKRDELLSELTYKHPKVKAILKKIDTLKRKISLNIKNLKREIVQTNRSLNRLKTTYEKKIKKLPTKERRLVGIKRDYEVSSKLYNFLLQKKAENEMIRVAIASDYKVIDRPYSKKIPINYKLILIVSTLLGLIAGVILAFLYDIFRDRVLDIEDIERRTNLPVYRIFTNKDDKLCKNLDSILLESYRNLRTALKLYLKDTHKVILITSTTREERPDIVSVNLAKVFAMAEYKTILVDLNIREPSVDGILELKGLKRGLVDYLISDIKISDIVYRHSRYGLDIVPVGKRDNLNPSEIILSDKLSFLIKRLKSSYDYVILNSTPFGFIQDTKYIMQYSDINLVVFREEYSKKSDILNLNRVVEREGIKNIGVVFIGRS